MNIQQAKTHIRNAIQAYRTRDEYGRLMIPQQRQRPVFLVGAPGIGKTAVMEQIAAEMGLPLVSYSMTHHTRQSALGLPFIVEENFGGKDYRVSEYTMSEIIATVYRTMRETGVNEGILFLDEINCVSETLAPAMLQFLQYKVFGQHKVPEGWIVVTAGNPPEYNDSVREFDMATMDRIKRLNVEPDYDVWHSYAVNSGVHSAIISYLNIYRDDFVKTQKSVDGMRFVTPRSWVDLSDMLKLYELHKLPVDASLTGQYLQNEETAKRFASYYDLFNKYQSDYQVDGILEGTAPDSIAERAKNAKFDERFSLISLLLAAVQNPIRKVNTGFAVLTEMKKLLQELGKTSAKDKEKNLANLLTAAADEHKDNLKKALVGNMITPEAERTERALIALLQSFAKQGKGDSFAESFKAVKKAFAKEAANCKKDSAEAGKALENCFAFCEKAFGEGQEILIFITELTRSDAAASFISTFGCDAYFKHNKELLFYERQVKLIDEIKEIEDLGKI